MNICILLYGLFLITTGIPFERVFTVKEERLALAKSFICPEAKILSFEYNAKPAELPQEYKVY